MLVMVLYVSGIFLLLTCSSAQAPCDACFSIVHRVDCSCEAWMMVIRRVVSRLGHEKMVMRRVWFEKTSSMSRGATTSVSKFLYWSCAPPRFLLAWSQYHAPLHRNKTNLRSSYQHNVKFLLLDLGSGI
ncbi:hypothetical protein KC19_10G032800 [Ceratodon purpureus]|uniref:Secreted protein n=1 Tax=Ceratodon purpureus TaxID=3225 RepID=A0A8T0GIX1_CERPU|nr:hypothetical protein KC19_10G032800 [Ceratodon purpureus]